MSNLTMASQSCNQQKGNQTATEFGFPEIERRAKRPLKDAAAMNATRWALFGRLKELGLPVETGSGGLTKFNRVRRDLPKAHWLDAVCVGKSTPERLDIAGVKPLCVRAMGHGSRQMCVTDQYGFPIRHRTHNKTWLGYQTGDQVVANIPRGKFAGKHSGRVTIRQRDTFMLNGFDVNSRYLRRIHRADGYSYQYGTAVGG